MLEKKRGGGREKEKKKARNSFEKWGERTHNLIK